MQSSVTSDSTRSFFTFVLQVAFGIFFISSCHPKADHKPPATSNSSASVKVSSVATSSLSGLTPGKSIDFMVTLSDSSVVVDSLVIRWDNQRLKVANNLAPSVSLSGLPLGRHTLTAEVFLGGRPSETHLVSIVVYSELAPQQYTYTKLQTFTHDPDAYTQGLLFHEGFLYESTGTRGESTLRKVELTTGQVLKRVDLADEYFGEGLTIYGDKLIQLTWTSHIGFVYSLESFEQTTTFNYPTEGWGLAVSGSDLVMSDGTENLYFLDPQTFVEKRRIQVYDHEKAITNLNELEVVGDKLYANVYQTDLVVIVDLSTGAVIGEINLAGIFNRSGYSRRLDVLNGIAWDKKGERLFVTGKWWPKLYQIEIRKINL